MKWPWRWHAMTPLQSAHAVDSQSPCRSFYTPVKLRDGHHSVPAGLHNILPSNRHSSTGGAIPHKLKSVLSVEQEKQVETLVTKSALRKDWVNTPWRLILDQLDQGCVDVDDVILAFLLRKSGDVKDLAEGKKVHVHIVSGGLAHDRFLGNLLIQMYGKCGAVEEASQVFRNLHQRNVFSWALIIGACVQNGHSKEAIEFYRQMEVGGAKPDKVTCIHILSACANQVALAEAYAQHGHSDKAYQLFQQMQREGVRPNNVTYLSILDGCVNQVALAEGRVFNSMPQRDVVLWSSMIAATAQHGQENRALQLFRQMQCEGVTPNRVTFYSILFACSHAGLVDECCYYLASMTQDHDIRPSVEHYNCLVDLLGRVGRLDEGENLIKNMPVQPSTMSWMTLLAACKMHLDVERGKRAAGAVTALDPGDATPYVLLSNIFAAMGRWDVSTSLKQIMQDEAMKKHLDYLCIMDEDDVHISSPSFELAIPNEQICT